MACWAQSPWDKGDGMADQAWRVLIVDDEPPIRAELNYLLKQDGRVGRIEEAGGATEAPLDSSFLLKTKSI